MDLDITKNWLENQTLSLEVGTEFDKLISEVERLKAENEQLKANQELWGSIELITAQRKEKEQLRKALEKTWNFLIEERLYGFSDLFQLIDKALKDST